MSAPSPRPAHGSKLRREAIAELFTRLRALDPQPTTELEYTTPFELLVAVVLSAQATDVGVNKATRKLYPVANTPAAILALGEVALRGYINTIGLFNAKAANVIALCRLLLERHGGAVPRTREALEALPGVGRKTANVVLNTAFGDGVSSWRGVSSVYETAAGSFTPISSQRFVPANAVAPKSRLVVNSPALTVTPGFVTVAPTWAPAVTASKSVNCRS